MNNKLYVAAEDIKTGDTIMIDEDGLVRPAYAFPLHMREILSQWIMDHNEDRLEESKGIRIKMTEVEFVKDIQGLVMFAMKENSVDYKKQVKK